MKTMRRFKARALFGTVVFLGFFLLILQQLGHEANNLTGIDEATLRVLSAVGSRNTSSLVMPNKSTVILEPTQSCYDLGAGLITLFMVISSPENFSRREAIRLLHNERNWYQSAVPKNRTKILFFIGVSRKKFVQERVKDEWLAHGDLIMDDFMEAYLNLTLKTLRMLKWTVQNCPDVRFLIKIDDDVHLNVPKLFNLLRQFDGPEAAQLIAGHKYVNVAPDDDASSKWFTPGVLWPEPNFPDFIAGFCYVLGSSAMSQVYEASLQVPLFHLEDVFLTGIVANRTLKLKSWHIEGIVTRWTSVHHYLKGSCYFNDFVVVHPVPANKLRCYSWLNSKDFVCSLLRTVSSYC